MPPGSVHRPILSRLLRYPTRVVAHDDRRSYKGAELIAGAAHIARLVKRTTNAPRVGLMLPTSGAFPIAALGCWWAGRSIVPLNYLLTPDELDYIVRDAEIDLVITAGVLLDATGHEPNAKTLVRMEDLNFKRVPFVGLPADADGEDDAAVVYTSGTSGRPKGVRQSHRAIAANARQGADRFEFGPGDVMLGVLPQFHSYGLTHLTVTPLRAGVPVVYTARFVPRRLVELMREQRATVFVGTPSMYAALCSVKKAGPEDLATMRLPVSGSEPLSRAVNERFREKFGRHLVEGYGMTEMAPATHCQRQDDVSFGHVGPPLPDVVQRVVDPATGEEVGPGEDGEIRLDGPNKMTGYLGLDEATAAAFDEKGFYRTGDQGRINEDGTLSITGRIKELIIVAGENVAPREIEEAVEAHPAVKASGAVGKADDLRGEVPVLFVEFEEGATASEQELIDFLRERLAAFKVPKHVFVSEQLPRSPIGKVLRRALKDRLAS